MAEPLKVSEIQITNRQAFPEKGMLVIPQNPHPLDGLDCKPLCTALLTVTNIWDDYHISLMCTDCEFKEMLRPFHH